MATEISEIQSMTPTREPPKIERSLASWRNFFSATMTVLCVLASLLAMAPLFSVLIRLIREGLSAMSIQALTSVPPPFGAGFGNAIVGTLVTVAIGGLLSIPFGILVGLYLSEFAQMSRTSTLIRFSLKVLTGIPSIIAGVFA